MHVVQPRWRHDSSACHFFYQLLGHLRILPDKFRLFALLMQSRLHSCSNFSPLPLSLFSERCSDACTRSIVWHQRTFWLWKVSGYYRTAKAKRVIQMMLTFLLHWHFTTSCWQRRMSSSPNPVAEGCPNVVSFQLRGTACCRDLSAATLVTHHCSSAETLLGPGTLDIASTISSVWDSVSKALHVCGSSPAVTRLVTSALFSYWLASLLNDFSII